jgi:hypothetical protein
VCVCVCVCEREREREREREKRVATVVQIDQLQSSADLGRRNRYGVDQQLT